MIIKALLAELTAMRLATSGLISPYASDLSAQLAGSKIDKSETSSVAVARMARKREPD